MAIADDDMTADAAFRLACEGTALLWRGDFQNARQLLNAMARRADRQPPKPGSSPAESFHFHRQTQSRRARILGMLLVALEDDYAHSAAPCARCASSLHGGLWPVRRTRSGVAAESYWD